MIEVEWRGGPLDGCTEDIERPTLTWIGPDLAEPDTKVVVYVLMSTKDARRHTYDFRKDLTDKANQYLEEQRGVT